MRVSQAAERVASLFADRAQVAEVDAFFAKHKASRLLLFLFSETYLCLRHCLRCPVRAVSLWCTEGLLVRFGKGTGGLVISFDTPRLSCHLLRLLCTRRPSRATRAMRRVPKRA